MKYQSYDDIAKLAMLGKISNLTMDCNKYIDDKNKQLPHIKFVVATQKNFIEGLHESQVSERGHDLFKLIKVYQNEIGYEEEFSRTLKDLTVFDNFLKIIHMRKDFCSQKFQSVP